MDLTLKSNLYNNLKFNMQKLILDVEENDYDYLASIFKVSGEEVKKMLYEFEATLEQQAGRIKQEITLPEVREAKTLAFIGDSITSDRESYFHILRKLYGAKSKLQFIDASVSGDKSDDARMKFYYRAMKYKPDIVHILIGTNDLRENEDQYGDICVSLDDYQRNLSYMIQTLLKQNVKVIITTISPVINERLKCRFPEDNWIYHSQRIDALNEIIAETAKRYEIKLNDMRAVYGQYRAEDILLADGLHLNEKGQYLLTKSVLKALSGYLEA